MEFLLINGIQARRQERSPLVPMVRPPPTQPDSYTPGTSGAGSGEAEGQMDAEMETELKKVFTSEGSPNLTPSPPLGSPDLPSPDCLRLMSLGPNLETDEEVMSQFLPLARYEDK